jgi:large subunit ribosomal protein L1
MNKESIIKALQELRKTPKKKFSQSIDLIINLKDVDLKKPTDNVDFFMSLPINLLKKRKICAFVGAELADQAKKFCDFVITQPEFDKYDKKAIKKLANTYDYFIAQANIMVKVAAKFGRILGTRGKMPNPKAGCVVSPKGNVQTIVEKLQTLVRLKSNKSPVVHITIGTEDAKDEDLIKNAVNVIDQIIHHLPKEESNIKNILLKMTMSKPIRLGKL